MIIEPIEAIVFSAFSNHRIDLSHSMDSFALQENEKTNQELEENNAQEVNEEGSSSDCNIDCSVSGSSCVPANSDVNSNIRSLKSDQKYVSDVVHWWARNHVKYWSPKLQLEVKPVHLFITSGGACGNSHLLRTFYLAITET